MECDSKPSSFHISIILGENRNRVDLIRWFLARLRAITNRFVFAFFILSPGTFTTQPYQRRCCFFSPEKREIFVKILITTHTHTRWTNATGNCSICVFWSNYRVSCSLSLSLSLSMPIVVERWVDYITYANKLLLTKNRLGLFLSSNHQLPNLNVRMALLEMIKPNIFPIKFYCRYLIYARISCATFFSQNHSGRKIRYWKFMWEMASSVLFVNCANVSVGCRAISGMRSSKRKRYAWILHSCTILWQCHKLLSSAGRNARHQHNFELLVITRVPAKKQYFRKRLSADKRQWIFFENCRWSTI